MCTGAAIASIAPASDIADFGPSPLLFHMHVRASVSCSTGRDAQNAEQAIYRSFPTVQQKLADCLCGACGGWLDYVDDDVERVHARFFDDRSQPFLYWHRYLCFKIEAHYKTCMEEGMDLSFKPI